MRLINLDEKELKLETNLEQCEFYGDRESDVVGFGGVKRVSLCFEFQFRLQIRLGGENLRGH